MQDQICSFSGFSGPACMFRLPISLQTDIIHPVLTNPSRPGILPTRKKTQKGDLTDELHLDPGTKTVHPFG